MNSIAENRALVLIAAGGVVLLIIALVLLLPRLSNPSPQTPTPSPTLDQTAQAPTTLPPGGGGTEAPPTETAVPATATTEPPPSATATSTPTVSVSVTATTESPAAETATPTPTRTPAPTGGEAGTIAGQVALQGRETAGGINVMVDGVPHAVTESDGTFSVIMPAGRYTVRASYPKYLPIEQADVAVQSGETTSLPPAILPAGDVDEDGDVDLFDLVRCAVNLRGGVIPGKGPADVNGDHVVDIRDFLLTRRNYGRVGPAPWSE